ncbi:hypothetical protein PG994_001791 [Apiospora phragmitis]|uniref:Aminoglycoside phosphotransferase domain-containing protein n=1 Tax=Apiospora phragmitis TaxID=2905665 RepID=A0ABR1WUN5_9PEZI
MHTAEHLTTTPQPNNKASQSVSSFSLASFKTTTVKQQGLDLPLAIPVLATSWEQGPYDSYIQTLDRHIAWLSPSKAHSQRRKLITAPERQLCPTHSVPCLVGEPCLKCIAENQAKEREAKAAAQQAKDEKAKATSDKEQAGSSKKNKGKNQLNMVQPISDLPFEATRARGDGSEDSFVSDEANIDDIIALCQQLWSLALKETIQVQFLDSGTFNQVFVLSCADIAGQLPEVVLQLPSDQSSIPCSVAILEWLNKHTDLKVPKVITWDATKSNPLKHGYIIMSRIPGQSLQSVWKHLSQEQNIIVTKEIAQLYQQMESVTSPIAGRINTSLNRPNPDDHLLVLFEPLQEMVQGMADSELFEPENDHICLQHPDFFPRNIMIDFNPDPVVTGIIDWDDANFVPRFAARLPPRWLWQTGWWKHEDKDDETEENNDDEYENDECADGKDEFYWVEEPLDDEGNAPETPDDAEIKRVFEEAVGEHWVWEATSPWFPLARRILQFSQRTLFWGRDFPLITEWKDRWDGLFPKDPDGSEHSEDSDTAETMEHLENDDDDEEGEYPLETEVQADLDMEHVET